MAEVATKLLKAENELVESLSHDPALQLIQNLTVVSDDTIERESGINRADFQKSVGILRVILSSVVEHNYERALSELEAYLDSKSEYPKFRVTTARHMQYARELINAIRAKREFSAVSSLSNSKQQELQEKVFAHFRELRQILNNVEQIERELRLKDLRSTVILMRTATYSFAGLFFLTFVLHFINGTYFFSIEMVWNDLVIGTANLISRIFGV